MDLNLDEHELNRLSSFYNVHDRNTFAVCRFYLKKLASEFLDLPIDNLKIGYGTNGKPFIENEKLYKRFKMNSKIFKMVSIIGKTKNL